MAEMTKTRWEDLNGKGQWDIMVALRGPDCQYGETVKWFTTSVIRGHMRGIFRVGGLVNPDLKIVVLPAGDTGSASEKFDAAGKYGWNHRHFCEHVATAAMWIKIPILCIEGDLWHKAMSKGSTVNAAELIFEAATKARGEEAKEDPYIFRRGLYAPEEIKELKRHMAEGRLR